VYLGSEALALHELLLLFLLVLLQQLLAYNHMLKGPKHEIFGSRVFTQIRPAQTVLEQLSRAFIYCTLYRERQVFMKLYAQYVRPHDVTRVRGGQEVHGKSSKKA
jgi:hypothetical protein